MLNRFLLSIIFVCNYFLLYSQSNQVLNPSMEMHTDTSLAGIVGFTSNFVTYWSDPGNGTADYFLPNSYGNTTTPPNTYFGFEYPHSGRAFGGFIFLDEPPSDYYENVQGSFRTPLIAGKTYGIECFVSIAEYGVGCTSNLGFYFSDTQVIASSTGILPFTPQFENPTSNMITTRVGWQRITGNYMAHGGEKYVCIGNFTPYALCNVSNCGFDASYLSAYLLLDDVAVFDTAVIDTIRLCRNDSIEINGQWHTPSSIILSETIGSVVVRHYLEQRPESVSYTEINVPYTRGDTVQIGAQWICYSDTVQRPYYFCDSLDTIGACYHTIYLWPTPDTFVDAHYQNIYGCDSTIRYICKTNVGIGEIKNKKLDWSVFPNPANDFLSVKINNNEAIQYSISIIDLTGKELLSQRLNNEAIYISSLTSGMYFVKLLDSKTGKLLGTEKFVKK